MALGVYLVPPDAGSSRRRLLEEAIGSTPGRDFSDILYLAPTRLLLKRWTAEFHEFAFNLGRGACYIPPRSMTLREFSTKICREFGNRIIIPKALVPAVISVNAGCGPGLADRVAKFIGELKRQYPGQTPSDIREILSEAFADMGMPDEAWQRALKAMDMFEDFDSILSSHDAMDDDDALAISAILAGKHINVRTLVLDGFYELTPSETLLIKALVEKGENAIALIPVSSINDQLTYCYVESLKQYFNITPRLLEPPKGGEKTGLNGGNPMATFHPAPSIEEEVEEIARRIKADYISGKRRELEEIVVVFPEISLYRDLVERVFTRYGIPYCLSEQKSLLMLRPYQDVMNLLEAVAGDFPRLATARAFLSPHFEKIPADLREATSSIALDGGLVKGERAWLNAFRDIGLQRATSGMFKVFKNVISINKTASYAKHSKVLVDVLGRLGFRHPEGCEELFVGVLNRLGHLDAMVSRGVDPGGFVEALKALLDSEHLPGLRDYGQGVLVASLYEVRGLEPGMLYIGGLKDGDIPSRPDMDFLLPDSLRRRLGLTDMKRHMHLQGHIFHRISASAEGVFMSYPSMEGDRFYLPSILLSGAEPDPSAVRGIFCEQERMLRGPEMPLSSHIREISKIKSFKPDTAFRITDIDGYRACPRRFAIERLFGLEPPEIKDYEMEPMTMGTIVHEVMERLIPRAPSDIENFSKKASETIDEVLSGHRVDSLFKKLLKDAFLDIVPRIFGIEEEIQERGYLILEAEGKVEGEPLKGIKLKGKVDRINSGPGGSLEVVDYKTGAVSISSSRVLEKGADLQLFLYAALLKHLGKYPERVGIYSLKEPGIKWFPTERDRKKGLSLDDFIQSSLKYLEVAVEGMRGGDFRAMPLEEHLTCRNCPERPYCPFIQGGEPEEAIISRKPVAEKAK